MDIQIIDIVVAASIIYSLYTGFCKGLIISIASLVGLILGVWGAIKFSGLTATYLNEQWEIQIPIVSFAVTFVVILLAVYLLGKLLEKVVNILSLGLFNKVGGAVFSGVKMILVLTVLFTIFNQVNLKYQIMDIENMKNSFSYPYLVVLEKFLLPYAQELFGDHQLPQII